MDPSEREDWFREYLRAALKFPHTRGNYEQAARWARSMSLIAEQFTDRYSGEPADVEPVE